MCKFVRAGTRLLQSVFFIKWTLSWRKIASHGSGVSVDNTSVNLGKNNSLFTRITERNPAAYFMGCPCHIVHNTCLKASASFRQVSK